MAPIVKSGYLQKYSKQFHEGGWKNIWIVLHQDGFLEFFKKAGDAIPKGHVSLKEVYKRFAVGRYTDGIPDRPSLPRNANMDYIIAVPQKSSSKAKVHWLLCANDTEFKEWYSAIVGTLPPLTDKPHSQPPPPPAAAAPQPVHYGPPHGPQPGQYGPPPAYSETQPVYPYHPYPQTPGYYPPQACPYPYQQPYLTYPYQSYPCQSYPYPEPEYCAPTAHVASTTETIVVEKERSGHGGLVAGLAGGALLGIGAAAVFGGFGRGKWGSWSSLSSCSSFGSLDSFWSSDSSSSSSSDSDW